MKKFKYSLQSLLDVRIAEEKNIKGEFAQAQQKVVRLEEELAQLIEQLKEKQMRYEEVLQGGISPKMMKEYFSYFESFKHRINRQRHMVKDAERNLEFVRERLVEARKNIKMLETHKEHKRTEYKKELEIEENKALDDFISYRTKQANAL